MRHPSWVNESQNPKQESNERLEFLGDAVIYAVIAETVYEKYPDFDEGELTTLRSSVVKGDYLAKVSRKLGIGDQLLLGNGEEGSGGRNKDSNLANAFEALVGAFFLDRGYLNAKEFILENLDVMSKRSQRIASKNDPKTELMSITQSKFSVSPHYRIARKYGPPHKPTFIVEVLIGEKVIATGKSTSRNRAEKEAASKAIRHI